MSLLLHLRQLLRQKDGPLTSDLSRQPAGFGIGQVPRRLRPDATTTTTCGFCSTGCGLELHLRDGQAINLSPAADYPVNLGMACPKGWEALTPLSADDRATTPLIRNKNGRLAPTSWPEALEALVGGFRGIMDAHGPEAVAFLGTGQITSEELALFGALCKFGMGMVHGDGNTRQCMASAVVAYKQAFGFDAPPYTYADYEESDVLVFVGANPCIAHPIMWERVCNNPHRPTIIVVDPRKTETAMAATAHLPLRPKSDLALFYGIAAHLVRSGRIDEAFARAHTSNFDELATFLKDYSLESAAQETGLSLEAVERLATTIADGKRVSFWWTMGVNQSHEGVRVAQSLINLALLTGNIGRPGTGPNSITGQCNAMGSRLFSNTTSLFAGRDFESARDRREVAELLGIEESRIPTENSASYDRIMEGVLEGRIKGLWVVATNTAHSWINQNDAHDILSRLDFLVVQDMYTTTETARLAHLLLPAAGWAEKEGTFINSERRVGLVKKAARAPGQALADFYIFKLVAEAWGVGDLFSEWTSPEATFQILKRLTRGRPCDITGIEDYQALDSARGIQWPLREGQTVEPRSERRLFEDGRYFYPDGRARFVFETPRPLPEPADSRFPFTLLTGRGSSSQWHTETRTKKSAVLRALSSEAPYVEISAVDAERLGITASEPVVVQSRRGKMTAIAHVTHAVQPGQVFVPMHYAETNRLTFAAFDPYSRQPAYKACAVRLLRGKDLERGPR